MIEWFELPWRDTSCAAGLAAELCRIILPYAPRLRVTGTGTKGSMLVQHVPNKDSVEFPDARAVITQAIRFVEALANGEIMHVVLPRSFEDYNGNDHVSRVYYAARQYGKNAKENASAVSISSVKNLHKIGCWAAAGDAAFEATAIVQKWAAASSGNGYAYNTHLLRIAFIATDRAFVEFDEIARSVVKWRYRDACNGRCPTERERIAFECAWEIGKYDLGYELLDDSHNENGAVE